MREACFVLAVVCEINPCCAWINSTPRGDPSPATGFQPVVAELLPDAVALFPDVATLVPALAALLAEPAVLDPALTCLKQIDWSASYSEGLMNPMLV